jgi:hypothetical protein
MNALIARCTGGCAGLILVSAPLLIAVFFSGPEAKAGQIPEFAFSIYPPQMPGGVAPATLATDAAGNIYTCSGSTIIKLARNGDYLNSWDAGTTPGIPYPAVFTLDAATNVYVIDMDASRVKKFDHDGQLLDQWGTFGIGPGQILWPQAIAVNSSRQVYVADSTNRVQIFTETGSFLGILGSGGTNAGQFSTPVLITIDSSDNVYVADFAVEGTQSYRVQKFDSGGTFITQWQSHGSGSPNTIEGMTTDPAHNVYVSDEFNHRVEKYTTDGVFVGEVGSYGTGPGQFQAPRGVTVDPSGNYVYVAESYWFNTNAPIRVYAYSALDPLIYASPTNQAIPVGTTLTLSAGVFGAQPMIYQWRFNGIDLAGETNTSMTISNAVQSNSGIYSIVASNSLGTATSSNAAISVLPVVVTTLPITSLTLTSAVLNGNAMLGVNASSVWFEWGTDTNYGTMVGFRSLEANTTLSLSYLSTNLSPHVTYHYRLVGSNSLGVVPGLDVQFIQNGLKPQLTAAPQVFPAGLDSVAVSVPVNPGALETGVYFHWGTGYGGINSGVRDTAVISAGNGVRPVPVQTLLTGLVSNAYYSAQAIASNQFGSVTGAITSFIGPPWKLLNVPQRYSWRSLATSADGTKVAGVTSGGGIWLSIDSGTTWTNQPVGLVPFQAISMSADGKRLVAVPGNTGVGPVYFSTNHGNAWNQGLTPDRAWYALASSGDGLAVAGANSSGRVLTSTNGGLNWTTNSPPPPPISATWSTIASSADGQRLIVAAADYYFPPHNYSPLYTSTNAGISWRSNTLPLEGYWASVASSADGQTLVAAAGRGGPIYVSTNSGASWATSDAPYYTWQSVAVSADGSRMFAVEPSYSSRIFVSTNRGHNWQSQSAPGGGPWYDIICSADGSRLFGCIYDRLLTLQTTPAPQLETQIAGSQLLVSWTVPSQPFTLQQANDLSAPQWTDVTKAPLLVYTNVHYQVAVPASNARGFYRLRGQ